MFSSPGMPKIYSTPSFSRHVTRSLAAVDSKCAVIVSPSRECISFGKHMLWNIDVALHQPACGTSRGGLFYVPALSLLVNACRQVHHPGRMSEPEHPARSCPLCDHLMHQRAWNLGRDGSADGAGQGIGPVQMAHQPGGHSGLDCQRQL